MVPVVWDVLSSEQPKLAAGILERRGALICLSAEQYENLALNMADIVRFIEQVSITVTQYEKDLEATF